MNSIQSVRRRVSGGRKDLIGERERLAAVGREKESKTKNGEKREALTERRECERKRWMMSSERFAGM
jgi:hypothetical protein